MQDLLDTLKQCVERLDRYRRPSQRVGESNTKAGLIEPIIAALGWDVLDSNEIHREYRRRPADNPVDYALLLSRASRRVNGRFTTEDAHIKLKHLYPTTHD